MDWQPIETAPKERNRLLLGWDPHLLCGQGCHRIIIWATYLAENRDCWMSFEAVFPAMVTHWMPLPEPPE